jgi:anti-anti-sigma factor
MLFSAAPGCIGPAAGGFFVQGIGKGRHLPPQHHFDVRVREQGSTALLSLTGEFDIAARPIMTAALDRLDVGGHTKQLIIDLRELDFMDSTGVTLLYERDAMARADGHNVTVVRGRSHVQHICTLSGIDARLLFIDDPAELRPPV